MKENEKINTNIHKGIELNSLSPEDKMRRTIFLELANIAIQVEFNLIKEIKSATKTCFIVGVIMMAVTTVLVSLVAKLFH